MKTSNPKNKIISRNCAIIDGKQTGLAGCDSIGCEFNCIRKDPLLITKENLKSVQGDLGCRYFIPITPF